MRRPASQTAQIEGQPFAQQFQPHFILGRRICAARLQRFALGNKQTRRRAGSGIMAQRNGMLARYKREYRRARGPFARREQQEQPCGISVLRR
jgi:hypothetical protein